MLEKFIKYQSLGNNFILFDWYQASQDSVMQQLDALTWASFVRTICDRNIGVGADGVLILKKNTQDNIPEMLIFNADGTQAETCLNGLRCVTHYLVIKHKFPEKFFIKLGKRTIECVIERDRNLLITNNIGSIEYHGEKTLSIITENQKTFYGHVVSVGNPHFVIFKETNLDWLTKFGNLLESHEIFPNKSNIEFVWQEPVKNPEKNSDGYQRYNVLVYERGCGITQACSSGAAAITGLLYKLKKIIPNQKIELLMLGGSVISWVDDNEHVFLQAGAQEVFSGILNNS